MTIKAILFDMDGVLIEAKEWHYEALNKALTLFGMPINRYDHLNTFDGLPTRKKLEMLSLENTLPEELHGFISEMKQKYTQDLINILCKPCFIHEYALSTLKAAGYKIAVCSNSIRNTIFSMMDRANLLNYVDYIVSNEDVILGKPAPDIYIKAIEHFGLKPVECLIIEDNETGIKAALATGAHLYVVKDTADTNWYNIHQAIRKAEGQIVEGTI